MVNLYRYKNEIIVTKDHGSPASMVKIKPLQDNNSLFKININNINRTIIPTFKKFDFNNVMINNDRIDDIRTIYNNMFNNEIDEYNDIYENRLMELDRYKLSSTFKNIEKSTPYGKKYVFKNKNSKNAFNAEYNNETLLIYDSDEPGIINPSVYPSLILNSAYYVNIKVHPTKLKEIILDKKLERVRCLGISNHEDINSIIEEPVEIKGKHVLKNFQDLLSCKYLKIEDLTVLQEILISMGCNIIDSNLKGFKILTDRGVILKNTNINCNELTMRHFNIIENCNIKANTLNIDFDKVIDEYSGNIKNTKIISNKASLRLIKPKKAINFTSNIELDIKDELEIEARTLINNGVYAFSADKVRNNNDAFKIKLLQSTKSSKSSHFLISINDYKGPNIELINKYGRNSKSYTLYTNKSIHTTIDGIIEVHINVQI